MPGVVRSSASWLRSHAIPAVAVTLMVGAAAGGGIAYAATTAHSAPAPFGGAPTWQAPNGKANAAGLPLVREVVASVMKQTGLTIAQVKADLAKGETLDQIAGSKAATIEDRIVNAITTRISKRHLVPGVDTSTSAVASRVRTRVHAVMTEPGTQLLQTLNSRRVAFANPPPQRTHPNPAFRRPKASPGPSAAA